MPEITTLHNRKKHTVTLYCGETELAVIDEELWESSPLRGGDEITADEIMKLQEQSDIRRAKNKALDYLSRRSYGEKELLHKLTLYVGEQAAQAAVERMKELNLIDDEAFARMCAERLRNVKHMAPKAITLELRRKGIERTLADCVAQEMREQDDSREHIARLLRGKYAGAVLTEKGMRRAVNGLLRLGYEYYDIKAVLREIKSADGEEIQEDDAGVL